MKKKIRFLKIMAVLLVTVVSTNQLTAQWEKVLAKPYNNYFTDVWFVAGDDGLYQTGWVTEYHGDIYKTTDGGDNWTMYTQEFSERLAGIFFIDENTGYMCTYNRESEGIEGMILKSTDGGETWEKQIGDVTYWFSSIRFKDEMNGVVSGNPNMYTHDGGVTWEVATPSGDEDYYYGFADYAADDTYYSTEIWGGYVGKSTDGGETWENIYQEENLLNNYISCLDGQHIMTSGSNERVLFTHDGGENWELVTIDDGQGDAACQGWVDADTMYVAGSDIYKSTDGGYNWIVDTVIGAGSHKDMFVTPTNVVYVINDIITGENSLWRKIGVMPANADFVASETEVCTGSSVDFTDLSVAGIISWQWSFPGGSPSSSTEQNPTVTYNNTGEYDVTLSVENSMGVTGTLTKSDYIKVLVTPDQAQMPEGDEGICTGNPYVYTIPTVDFAQDYEWEASTAAAGELTWDQNEAYFDASDDWTGDFTLKVRATNLCGDGEWSDELTITISQTPEVYSLGGGGVYCAGGEGVELTLDGSQTGVDYELYLEGEPTGQIVSGTGGALSFGNQTEAGIYEAVGFNDNCETYMSEQVEVVVNPLPTPEVSGLDMVCDEDVTDYETTDNAGSTYAWEVTGGTVIDGQGTYMATIEWGAAGDGTVTVTEEDENGCTATTEAFDVFIDDCTDISENGLNEFNVYPNPATSRLNVEFTNGTNEDARIIIFNHLGQVVLESDMNAKDGKQNVQFDVSGLTKGLYIIKVQSGNESVITKQIIKN